MIQEVHFHNQCHMKELSMLILFTQLRTYRTIKYTMTISIHNYPVVPLHSGHKVIQSVQICSDFNARL